MSSEGRTVDAERIRQRIAALKQDDEAAARKAVALRQQLEALDETRRRIQGALQVLGELLEEQERTQ